MKAQGPGQSALLLLDVVEVFTELSVPYAVIGAMAAAFYGTVRASADADVLIGLDPHDGNVTPLLEQLGTLGLDAAHTTGDATDPIRGVIRVTDSHGNRADLLMGIRGLDPAAFSRAVTVPLYGADLRMIGLEDFIAMKAAAGSPKDLADIGAAMAVSFEQIDRDLLKRLTVRYGRHEWQTVERLLKDTRQP